MRSEIEVQEYGAQLYERRNEAIMLKWADASIGDWFPNENECHQNVTNFCYNVPEFKPVRGWLYFNLGDALSFVIFIAHSAILSPEGEYFDITPQTRATQQYPFIIANETEEEYANFVESDGIGRIEFTKR